MDENTRRELLEALKPLTKRRELLTDVPMSRYTTLKLGGPAELLCEVSSVEQLCGALRAAARLNVPVNALGNGSNLLVLDGGWRGLTLHFGDDFGAISDPVPLPDGRFALTAQSGATLGRLANAAADAGLSGLEFAAGIPGTVGGGVAMNAGAYGGVLQNVVESVTCVTMNGDTRHFTNEQMQFNYRHSIVNDENAEERLLVVAATLVLERGDSGIIRTAMREFNARRREKQPITLPSCGSTFKRPEGHFAGTLIEQCGLKGRRIGGVSVSELHAGFLVNDGGGTASDYMALIAEVQRVVKERTGVELQPEVRIVGEPLAATPV